MKFWELISKEMEYWGLNRNKLSKLARISRSTLLKLKNCEEPTSLNREALESFFGKKILKLNENNYEWGEKLNDKNDNEEITQGLKDLLDDEKTMRMMFITEAEVKWMKTIRFRPNQKPTKQDYIDLLFIYRNIGE